MSGKGPRLAEISVVRNLLGSLSIFFGGTWVLKMGNTVGPRYTTQTISAIGYLFESLSFCGVFFFGVFF